MGPGPPCPPSASHARAPSPVPRASLQPTDRRSRTPRVPVAKSPEPISAIRVPSRRAAASHTPPSPASSAPRAHHSTRQLCSARPPLHHLRVGPWRVPLPALLRAPTTPPGSSAPHAPPFTCQLCSAHSPRHQAARMFVPPYATSAAPAHAIARVEAIRPRSTPHTNANRVTRADLNHTTSSASGNNQR